MQRENILDELECPICMEYMVEKIICCNNGHNLCGDCRNDLEKNECPVCKEHIGTTRNISMEKIACTVEFPCKNEGCGEVFPGAVIKDHYTYCQYGLFSCGFDKNGCKWVGTLANMKNHIIENHNQFFESWCPIESKQLYICFHYESIFFVFYQLKSPETAMYSAMYIGPKHAAQNFLLNVQFEDQTDKGYRMCGTTPCIPHQEFRNCFDHEKILFSKEMMSLFLKMNRSFASDILILKKY